jgi:hypothetical protein
MQKPKSHGAWVPFIDLQRLILALHLSFVVFCNIEHWIAKLNGQCSIQHWPSTQIFSFNSRPPWDTKGSNLLEPEGGCCMCTSSKILGLAARTNIHGQKKFTWSKMMGIIVNVKRTINRSLKRPKNLFTFELR